MLPKLVAEGVGHASRSVFSGPDSMFSRAMQVLLVLGVWYAAGVLVYHSGYFRAQMEPVTAFTAVWMQPHPTQRDFMGRPKSQLEVWMADVQTSRIELTDLATKVDSLRAEVGLMRGELQQMNTTLEALRVPSKQGGR